MADKVEPKDLEKVLARLTAEWQELAGLLTSLGKSPDRVVEVEKVLLRDAAGHLRGKISADPGGSADLFLSDLDGKAWARLGVNPAGEAFLELKDPGGATTFTAAGGLPAAPAPEPPREAPPRPQAEAGDHQPQAPAEPHNRRQKIYWAIILVVLGVVLATQAYILFRPHSPGLAVEALVVRDANGRVRASLSTAGDQVKLDLLDLRGHRRATLGLGSDGAPALSFYDPAQRLRAQLNLGPDGQPKLTLQEKPGLPATTAPKPETPPGPKAGAAATPPAPASPPAPAVAPAPEPAPEPATVFYGFKRSNKYHYPWCKFLKGAKPEWLIKFKSAADAQAHHYIPCPVCKPPPLNR
jgi:hypothetical protein